MVTYYVQPHVTQFDGAAGQSTACVPGSLANGVAASTGGAKRPSCGAIHRLIPQSAETDPSTPGWSLDDADHAMAKLGIPFTIFDGWDDLVTAHKSGHYVIVQGDSDRFSNSTCSGAFNGDHCIGISPNTMTTSHGEMWWIDDPICKTGRWEYKTVIAAYAAKFAGRLGRVIKFGRFDHVVPSASAPKPPSVTLRYGGHAEHSRRKIAVPAGRKANVRTRPTTAAGFAPSRAGGSLNGGPNRLSNGTIVEYWQATLTGQLLAGSRVWYGDRTGTRWLHISSF